MLGYVEPIGGYDEVVAHAKTIPIAHLRVKVMSLDDLIRVKEHIRRPKDRDSLMQLLAIKRIRDEGK